MKFFKLALRNVFRNKRRTSITFLSIIAGMIALIVFGGFVEYSFWGLRESTIHSQLGHIQIFKKGYSEKGRSNPGEYLIKDFRSIEKKLYRLPEIELVTARLSFSGLISTGEKTLTCKGFGVIPEREKKLASFETLKEGSHLSAENKDEILVGVELKKSLGANMGDYLTILTTNSFGMINAGDLKLIGTGQSGSAEYDAVFVKIPLNAAQTLLDTQSIEKVVILLSKTEDTEKVVKKIQQIIDDNNLDLEIRTWDQLATYYNSVVRLYNGIFNVIKVIIAIIVFFSIANTMIMSIFERVKEIGTLRAIGTKKSGIMQMFLWEGFFVGVLGGILGIIAGVLVALIINISGGIYIPPPPGMGVGYQSLIFVVPEVLIYSYLSTVIVSTLSSIYPAAKAIRLYIVEAIAHT